MCFGAVNRPNCFSQYFVWISRLWPNGTNLHIVCVAALSWSLWKTRNRACFEGKLISSPVELICYMCAFLRYWVGLQKDQDKEVLTVGVSRLQQISTQIHEVARRAAARRIQPAGSQDQADEDVEVD